MLKQTLLSEMSRLADTGEAMAHGVVLDQTSGTLSAFTVPTGQVFLMTHIHVQAETLADGLGAAFDPTPDLAVYGFTANDTNGDGNWVFNWLAFRRWQSTFVEQNTPNWRNAPPCNVITWKPKYPIAVPPGWSLQSTTGGAFGHQIAVYGYLISQEGARTAGYETGNDVLANATNRRFQVFAGAPTTSSVDLIGARTGQCIRILDVHVRVQPATAGATNKVRLHQTDGRTVFSWTNNNPSDMLDLQFSPDIFLKAGQALQLIGTVASTASVIITCEYVDADEVPGDAWWGYVEPDLPTPSVTKVGSTSSFPTISTALTCYYPRQDSAGRTPTTKTSPLTGYQHIVRGWCFSAQKNAVTEPEQTLVALSHGTDGDPIEFAVGGIAARTNVQISPTYALVGHDRVVYAAIDDLNIPCKRDDGQIWVDTVNLNAATGAVSITATPTATDADIDEWSFTVWGKTVPNKFTNPTNRGT